MAQHLMQRTSTALTLESLTAPSNIPDSLRSLDGWYLTELKAVARRGELQLQDCCATLGSLHVSRRLAENRGSIELRSSLPTPLYRGIHQLRVSTEEGGMAMIIESSSPPTHTEFTFWEATRIARGRVDAISSFAEFSPGGSASAIILSILRELDPVTADGHDSYRVVSFPSAEGSQGLSSFALESSPLGIRVESHQLRAEDGCLEYRSGMLKDPAGREEAKVELLLTALAAAQEQLVATGARCA